MKKYLQTTHIIKDKGKIKMKQPKGFRIYLILAVIIVLMALTIGRGIKTGGTMRGTNTSAIRQFASINKLVEETNFKFNVPHDIVNNKQEIYHNISNRMVHIEGKDYIFKAAPFIDERLDIGANRNQFILDNTYELSEDSYIEYLRIRGDASENIRVLNWKHGNTAYYLEIKKEVELEQALKLIDIRINQASIQEPENTEEIIEDTEEVEEDTEEMEEDTEEMEEDI